MDFRPLYSTQILVYTSLDPAGSVEVHCGYETLDWDLFRNVMFYLRQNPTGTRV